ncbi:MAG: type II toxin-antitoxin system VapC family toxin [Rhodospirillales bacterium]|nr:type II toxin-antitoxin system VapC family toxin [Rhodospirillales bacterium]
MFLLDTNVISELRKAADGRADGQVLAWLSGVDAGEFYLSVITLMEIETGILRMERRDPVQGDRLRAWMDTRIRPEFADRILPIDKAVALRCALLHVPNPVAERDALIAATALVHGMTIVTRNMADFARTGVSLVNPWEGSASAGRR